jgi:hypothetical protein
LLLNVVLAGERRLLAQLHRPLARTAATVAGLFFVYGCSSGRAPCPSPAPDSPTPRFPQNSHVTPSRPLPPSQDNQRWPTPRCDRRWITKLRASLQWLCHGRQIKKEHVRGSDVEPAVAADKGRSALGRGSTSRGRAALEMIRRPPRGPGSATIDHHLTALAAERQNVRQTKPRLHAQHYVSLSRPPSKGSIFGCLSIR